VIPAELMQRFLSSGVPAEIRPILAACFGDAPAAVRIRRVESVLGGQGGESARAALGSWIAQIVSIDSLVPDAYGKWRPLVRDSIQFLFSHLSLERLAAKIVEQIDLPLDTPPARRLLALIARMPGIQKLGQVLARHQRLDPSTRKALSELENGIRDAPPKTIRAIIAKQLGPRLRKYSVKTDRSILSEASVSAVIRFTFREPGAKQREHGVFKVIKPHVRTYFNEDLALLQHLSDFLANSQGYGFATRHVAEMVSEVRLLLEHELDFEREQATLLDAVRTYRINVGIRVPRVIAPLCTSEIIAMSEEPGVKVTEVFPGKPYWRRLVAEQLVEALVTVPLLSRDSRVVFHADPHAGNLLYDERAGKIGILDWALTERLSRDLRRYLALLVIMTVLRNPAGVTDALVHLASASERRDPEKIRVIREHVEQFFKALPYNRLAGSLDAMLLMDEIALAGVRFPTTLAMFQKALFTLDGVLHDIAGSDVSISYLIVRDFVIRLLVSFGLDHPPLSVGDLMAVQRSGLLYPTRLGASALFGVRGRPGVTPPPSAANNHELTR
jgi:ubiquinone biosynthesis protein